MRDRSRVRHWVFAAALGLLVSLPLFFHFVPGDSFGTHEVQVVAKEASGQGLVGVRLEVAPSVFVENNDVLLRGGWIANTPSSFQADTSVRGAMTYRGSVGGIFRVHFQTDPSGGSAQLWVDNKVVGTFSLLGSENGEFIHEVRFAPERSPQHLVVGVLLFLACTWAWAQWGIPLLALLNIFSRKRLAGGIAVGLAIGFAVLVVGPVSRPPIRSIDLKIANAGAHDSTRTGDELWVRVLGSNGVPQPRSNFWTTGAWTVKPHGWLVSTERGSTLHAVQMISGDDSIEIYPTRASSQAIVEVNGRRHSLDSYAMQYSVRSWSLRSLLPSSTKGALIEWGTAILDATGIAAVMMLAGAYITKRRRSSGTARGTSPPPIASWKSYAIAPALLWLAQLLILWPGILSSDSADQWRQLSHGLKNAHPWVLSLLYGITRTVFGTPAAWIALMVLGISGIIGGFCVAFRRLGASERAVRIGAVLPAIVAPTNFLMLTLWKDVPYALGLLIISLVLVQRLVVEPDSLSVRYGVYLGAGGLLAIISRHNALPTVAIALVICAIWTWRSRRTAIIFAGVVGVLGISNWAINAPIASAANVKPSYSAGATLAYHIAAHIDAGTEMSNADREYLDSIMPTSEKWPYDCTTIGPTWLGLPVDYVAEESRLREIAVRLARSAPEVEARHALCASRIVWNIAGDDERTNGTEIQIRGDRYDYVWSALPESPQADPPSNQLAGRLITYSEWFPNAIQRPAIWFYALLLLLAVNVRRGNKLWLALGAVPLAHSVVLIPFNGSQDIRYQSPVLLIAALSIIPLWSISLLPVDRKPIDDSPESEPRADGTTCKTDAHE